MSYVSEQKMADFSINQFVSGNAFFAGLPEEFVDFLAAHAKVRQLGQDQVLFHNGGHASHFYVITRGHISVEVAAIEGPPLELQDLGPGAVVGWSWLISPHKWTFQARATMPTEILEFDGEAVLARCAEDAKFGYEVLKRFSSLMSERLQFARRRVMEEWRPSGIA